MSLNLTDKALADNYQNCFLKAWRKWVKYGDSDVKTSLLQDSTSFFAATYNLKEPERREEQDF